MQSSDGAALKTLESRALTDHEPPRLYILFTYVRERESLKIKGKCLKCELVCNAPGAWTYPSWLPSQLTCEVGSPFFIKMSIGAVGPSRSTCKVGPQMLNREVNFGFWPGLSARGGVVILVMGDLLFLVVGLGRRGIKAMV